MKINTNAWNRIRYTLYVPIYNLTVRALRADRQRAISALNLQPGERVLLIGAGTGEDLPLLPTGVEITAGDITPVMIDRLRQRAQSLNVPVEARVMDGQALDLPSNAYDVVILHLILAVIPDPNACFEEALRVLRVGGRISIYDKFLPDDARPSLLRRVLNGITGAVFTEINRQLGPILKGKNVTIERRERAKTMGRLGYSIVLLRKTETAPHGAVPEG